MLVLEAGRNKYGYEYVWASKDGKNLFVGMARYSQWGNTKLMELWRYIREKAKKMGQKRAPYSIEITPELYKEIMQSFAKSRSPKIKKLLKFMLE